MQRMSTAERAKRNLAEMERQTISQRAARGNRSIMLGYAEPSTDPETVKKNLAEDELEEKVMREMVAHDLWALENASFKLRDSKEFMLQAVKGQGLALQFGSTAMQDDVDVTRAATNHDIQALQFVSERLRACCTFMLPLVLAFPSALHLAMMSLQKDMDFINKVLQGNGMALQHVRPELQDDEDPNLPSPTNP